MKNLHDSPGAAHQNGRVRVVEEQLPVPLALPTDRRRSPRQAAPAAVYLELAKWVLAQEMSDGGEDLPLPDAAERACQKLLDRLAKLITASGSQALLARALHLSQADFIFLQGIEPGLTPETYLAGLRQSAGGRDPALVARGLATLLAIVIELVALFIGEQLMARLLLEVWPDLPVFQPTQR
jgi:hypothetical protein